MKLTNREGSMELIDGTGTPFVLAMAFDSGDFDGPMGQPRQEEILYLHRGTMDSNAHYVKGGDDALMAPLPFTFSFHIEDAGVTEDLINWLKACNDGATTKVGVTSNTLVTTAGDTQRDGATANPAPADSNKLLCDVQILWNSASGNDLSVRYYEVWFPLNEQRISESAEGVMISLSGQIYGTVAIVATASQTLQAGNAAGS